MKKTGPRPSAPSPETTPSSLFVRTSAPPAVSPVAFRKCLPDARKTQSRGTRSHRLFRFGIDADSRAASAGGEASSVAQAGKSPPGENRFGLTGGIQERSAQP